MNPPRQRCLLPAGHFLTRRSGQRFLLQSTSSFICIVVIAPLQPQAPPTLLNDLILMMLAFVPFVCFYFHEALFDFTRLDVIDSKDCYENAFSRQSHRAFTAGITL